MLSDREFRILTTLDAQLGAAPVLHRDGPPESGDPRTPSWGEPRGRRWTVVERRVRWVLGAGGVGLLLAGAPDAAVALWCTAGLGWLCARYWSVLTRADALTPRRPGARLPGRTARRGPAAGGEA